MKKSFLLATILLTSILLTFSQKKELTIEDAVSKQWRSLYPTHINGIEAYDENDFTYVKDYKELILISKNKKEDKTIVDLKEINEAITLAGHKKLNIFLTGLILGLAQIS